MASSATTTGKTGIWLDKLGRRLLLLLAFALGLIVSESGWLQDIILYWPDIEYLAGEHIMLVLVSGGLAILSGVPLGIWLSRPSMRHVSETLMQGLNIGATIPTLAVLALSMSFLGIGTQPSIFGLWLVSLLPIVRNTYIGLKGVQPALKEAAEGVGMGPARILYKVELPNALFVIFAGIRTALAINVGTVPLAFLIGGGGLGELIFTGIALNDTGMMLAGAVATAFLAIAVDFIVSQIQLWAIPRGVNPLR